MQQQLRRLAKTVTTPLAWMRPGALAVALTACPSKPVETVSAEAPETASQPGSRRAPQPPGLAAQRADEGKARLLSSGAGRIVLASTEYHGGLQAWFRSGALTFHYAYRPLGEGTPRVSTQTIDLMTSRAYHDLEEPMRGHFAWDGHRAWSKLEGQDTFGARFWALTPYYFVGMPFVLGDPGVRLVAVDDDPTDAGFEAGTHVVRATFEPGTGDAPDDYYVLYIDKDDHRLLGLRYIVTYFAGGAPKHPRERLLVYEDEAQAGPLKLARTHVTYAFPDGKRGEKVTVSKVRGVEYGARFDPSRLQMPEGAKVDGSKK